MEGKPLRVCVGEDAGPLLLDFLKTARRRLFIVSPWLSPACADMALRKQGEGVSTVIVTTNDEGRGHRLALSRLVERRKKVVAPRRWGLLAPGVALILGGLCSLPLAGSLSLLLLAAGGILCWAGRGRTEKYFAPLVDRLVLYLEEERPLHAKVYVVDDMVAVGSANFTVSGLGRNVECVAFADASAEETIRQVEEVLSRRKVTVLRREPAGRPP
jgi:phosphatidylserine/phosphatidylglycerophosphate/cardiolipin synthase-like enzyme